MFSLWENQERKDLWIQYIDKILLHTFTQCSENKSVLRGVGDLTVKGVPGCEVLRTPALCFVSYNNILCLIFVQLQNNVSYSVKKRVIMRNIRVFALRLHNEGRNHYI